VLGERWVDSQKRDDIQTIGDLGKRGMGTAIPRFEVQDLYSELAQIGSNSRS
jgi:NADH/NAD ratio-sensing transcriptional regulator Rex